MRLDRKMLDKLLMLNDEQLRAVIDKLVNEYHVDVSSLHIEPGDMEGLRRVLRSATDEELLSFTKQLRGGK